MTQSPHGVKEVLIKGTNIFSSLNEQEISLIAEFSELQKYTTDETVFSTGDPGNSLYIIKSGEVIVQKLDENGRKTHIARFLGGDCFGELDLFTETSRIVSSIVSVETSLLVFPKDNIGFSNFLIKNPTVSAKILHNIMITVAMRIREVNILVKENSPLVQELKKQVYRDKLTGLYNQTYLIEKIRGIINTNRSVFYLIICKPDNFKYLNDTYGHDAGDLAIQIMARGMRSFIGDDSGIVRYKGNAIAVLRSGATRREVVVMARSIREFMNNLDISSACKGNNFKITASIGVSIYPDHGEESETLLFTAHELSLLGRSRGGNLILFPEDRGKTE